jgi:hypothetical protein
MRLAMTSAFRFAATLSILTVVASANAEDKTKEKWVSLFDGKTMKGWEKVGNQMSVWEVKDGAICGSGPASMLVNTTGPYTNFRYRVEIKIND